MRLERWITGSVAAVAVAALTACAGQAPTNTAPQAERQVLSMTSEVDIPAMIAQLPERIPADQADALLVQVDPSKVTEGGASFSVMNTKDGNTTTRHRPFRRFFWGFSPGFGGLFNSFSYYPFGNYFFPYYYAGGYYYPYFFADRAYNPFFYGLGNNWIPAYWAR